MAIEVANAYAAWEEVTKVLGFEIGDELVDKIISENVGLVRKTDDKG